MKTSSTSIALAKLSAVQLINRMEKGSVNEEEKNEIISILKQRGKDTTPYEGKNIEQIKQEAMEDQALVEETTKKPTAAELLAKAKAKKAAAKLEQGESESDSEADASAKPKKVKAPREPREPRGDAKKVFYEDDTFKKGVKVKVLSESSKIKEGTFATVERTRYYADKPEVKKAHCITEDGLRFARLFSALEIVG
jgi:hypothetical protein